MLVAVRVCDDTEDSPVGLVVVLLRFGCGDVVEFARDELGALLRREFVVGEGYDIAHE